MAVIAFRASLPDISRLMSGAVSVIRFPNLSQSVFFQLRKVSGGWLGVL